MNVLYKIANNIPIATKKTLLSVLFSTFRFTPIYKINKFYTIYYSHLILGHLLICTLTMSNSLKFLRSIFSSLAQQY